MTPTSPCAWRPCPACTSSRWAGGCFVPRLPVGSPPSLASAAQQRQHRAVPAWQAGAPAAAPALAPPCARPPLCLARGSSSLPLPSLPQDLVVDMSHFFSQARLGRGQRPSSSGAARAPAGRRQHAAARLAPGLNRPPAQPTPHARSTSRSSRTSRPPSRRRERPVARPRGVSATPARGLLPAVPHPLAAGRFGGSPAAGSAGIPRNSDGDHRHAVRACRGGNEHLQSKEDPHGRSLSATLPSALPQGRQGVSAVQGGPRQAGPPVRVHPVSPWPRLGWARHALAARLQRRRQDRRVRLSPPCMHPAGAPAAPPPAPPTGELAWARVTPAAERGRGPCRQPLPGAPGRRGAGPGCRRAAPSTPAPQRAPSLLPGGTETSTTGPRCCCTCTGAPPQRRCCARVLGASVLCGSCASLAPPAALPRAGGWWTAGTRPPPGAWSTSTTRPSSGGEAGGGCCAWAGMVGCVMSQRLVPRWQRRGEVCSRGSAVLD